MQIVSASQVGDDRWDACCESFPTAWFWWTSEWRKYSLAYRPDAIDHSFAVCNGDRIVGLCQLLQEGASFAMGGNPCPWPLVERDEAMGLIMAEVDRIAAHAGIENGRWRSSPLAAMPTVSIPGTADRSIDSQVIDLRRPLDDLWRDVHDGHRAEIHRGLRSCDINRSLGVDEFQRLHERAHGQTRSSRTWAYNRRWWHEQADVFLAGGTEPIGGAYFLRYKNSVYYASAAWPAPHVAHAVLWTAIRHYQERGYQALEMGWLNTGSLAVFKRGFGGQAMPMRIAEKRWP